MKYLFAPLLLIAIIVGYVGVVIGLLVLHYVAGPAGAFVGLLALFGACLAIGSRRDDLL